MRNDAPQAWLAIWVDGATPTQEGLTELHNSLFFYLYVIAFAVS